MHRVTLLGKERLHELRTSLWKYLNKFSLPKLRVVGQCELWNYRKLDTKAVETMKVDTFAAAGWQKKSRQYQRG